MKRLPLFIALAGLSVLQAGCAWMPSLRPPFWPFTRGASEVGADPSFGVEVVDGPAIVDFHQRASLFYGRLAQRRFNVIASFRDEVLREYFRTDRAFSDYYADFAQDLDDAHFERNVPTALEVVEFRFEGPGDARVRVRIEGKNGRPLRGRERRRRPRGPLGAGRRHLVDRSRKAVGSRRHPIRFVTRCVESGERPTTERVKPFTG